jgi:hypothetical protein
MLDIEVIGAENSGKPFGLDLRDRRPRRVVCN